MALTNRNEIRAILESDWLDQLRESNYPQDLFAEIAEGLCPVYNGDILDEWRDLSLDESDTWQEFGRDEKATILDLMRADLFWHYHNEVAQIWAEIENEHTCEAELAPNLYKSSPMNGAIRCHDCDTLIIAECACEANEHDCQTN